MTWISGFLLMGAIVIHACLIQTAKVTSRWFFLSYGLLVSAALFDFSFFPGADWRFYVVVGPIFLLLHLLTYFDFE